MKNTASSREPITGFRLPPGPPTSVQAVYERFDKLGLEWASVKGSIDDAEEEFKALEKQNIRAAGEALADGKEPDAKAAAKAEAVAQAKVDALRRRKSELDVGMDELGNELADAIGADLDEWTSTTEAYIAELIARLKIAVPEVVTLVDDLGRARQSRLWLEDFDATEAKVGVARSFHGGGRVEVRDAAGTRPATALLKLVAEAIDPPPAPKPVALSGRARRMLANVG